MIIPINDQFDLYKNYVVIIYTLMSKPNTETISVNIPESEGVPLPDEQSVAERSIINQSPNNSTVVTVNSEGDVSKIITRIKNHLASFNYAASLDFNKDKDHDKVLTVGEYKISRECLLHYLSGNPDFLKSSAGECSKAIQTFSNESGNLDLESLLTLSPNKDFIHDTNFYKNLYGFNVSIADFIANNNEFKKANYNTQIRILQNYHEFLKQSIEYFNKYMNQYKVIDDNLISRSYNLMYLLNVLTFRRANVGRNINELLDSYNKLNQAIATNLAIYDSINKSKLEIAPEARSSIIDKGVQDLVNSLKQRTNILKKQGDTLKKNVEDINKDTSNLKRHATGDIIGIADSLRKEVDSVATSFVSTEKKK
ncbi:hypothetical protein [Acanthamoeba polyphaga mimivirus]|uniref:Uncharacterized protein n=1 Tax=Acanthamoeba polyphaga mimivirus TaxID=212035 RepID=A0A0G2Y0A4_MIMIV|nr:hypothetical protein [Acanthamoeba polyphaga mimivirus]